jgi:hypothetical protein
LDRFKASLCEFVRKTSGFECMCWTLIHDFEILGGIEIA